MTKLQQLLNCIDTLTPDEQKAVCDWIDKQQSKRNEQRKKELWGNVVAAIAKYQDEIKEIYVTDIDETAISLYNADFRSPGIISPCFD